MNRLNVGCGMSPTFGWINVDNSMSIRLAWLPRRIVSLLCKIGLIDKRQFAFIGFCRKANIHWCNAINKLPYANNSMEVIYSSHMLEHLDKQEANRFLAEAYRVLMRGGVIRLAVPGLRQKVQVYFEGGSADDFIESLHTCVAKPKTLRARLKLILVGPRHHHWMYDEASLCSLLERHGFHNALALKAGQTTITNPGPLDLTARSEESIYIEAVK
jgi:predicted SAM-dependent methyltransferase